VPTRVPTRREQVLDAAIAVLGRDGIRHLTHRAVDAAAGVPAGSTSNYFRTRDALVEAVISRFAERERAAWEEIAAVLRPDTGDRLAAALAAFVRQATTGPDRELTTARYAVFVEAALRPELQPYLHATMAAIRAWAARWLRDVGSALPERDCELLLNQLDGMMLHRLCGAAAAVDPYPELAGLIRKMIPKP